MPIGLKSLRRFSLLFLCLLGSMALIPARQSSVEAAPLPVEASAAQGPPFFREIRMISPTDGWIVASHGVTYHWNGTYWHRLPPIPGVTDLNSVSVVHANDVWAVGSGLQRPVIVRWNGSSWQHMPTPQPSSWSYQTISMLSATDGWIGGVSEVLHWNGTSWIKEAETRIPSGYVSTALSPTNVWMANPYLHHYNGTSWTYQDTKNILPEDIMFLSPQEGWLAGKETTFCYQDHCNYQGASAYWNGTSWIYVGLPTLITALSGIHTSPQTGTWAVGVNNSAGVIFRWAGSQWQSVPIPADVGWLVDIEMVSPTLGWAIGFNGEMLYWNGIKWQIWAADIRKVHIPMTAGE